ncbi:hypothetical protein [Nakamurella sp.]|uniref:hypothetical protein n=1 Tax=Nakamurella sp. TaxID=1869182 RepID=UPI003B3B59B1
MTCSATPGRPGRARVGRRPAARGAALVLLVAALTAGCTGAGPAGSTAIAPTGADPSTSVGSDTAAPPSGPPWPSSSRSLSPSPSASAPNPAPSDAPALTLRTVPLAPGVNDEASGVALATTAPGLLFLVDDGTGTAGLAVVDEQGALVTRVVVDGMSAGNAEALAAGPCGAAVPRSDGGTDGSCLYVGDIGDNAQQRSDVVIYRAVEPDLSGRATGDPITVAADEWHYTYPDRPQNAESMMVTPDGSIIVVTKPRNGAPHRMYRGRPGGGDLEFVREFAVPGSPRPMRTILTGNVATDLAATPGRVLLLTYDDVHEYTAPDPAADPSTFPDWPSRSLPMPPLPQAEGIAGASDGCGYVIASEAGPGGTAGSLGIATCR